MKKTLYSIVAIWFSILTLVPNIFAQDYRQWDLPDGVKTRFGKGAVSEIAYSPDMTRLAVASSIGIWIYDTQTGEELDLITGHTSYVFSVVFSPNGQMLASASDDKTVRLWDARTGTHLRTLKGHAGSVRDVVFSPDGTQLASASYDNTIRIGIYKQGNLFGHWQNIQIGYIVSGSVLMARPSQVRVGTKLSACGTYEPVQLFGHLKVIRLGSLT